MRRQLYQVVEKKNEKITPKLRRNLVGILFALFAAVNIFVGANFFYIQYRWHYLFVAFLFTVLMILYIKTPLEKKHPPKILVVLWFLTWVNFLLNTIFIQQNFLPVPILLLVFLPAFYLVIKEEDYAELLRAATKGICAVFVVFVILSLLFRPFIGRSYVGFCINANYMSQFITMVFALLLASIHTADKNRINPFIYLLIGFIVSFSFLSISRTSWISCAVVGVAWLFFQLYRSTKQSRRRLGAVVLKIVAGMLVATGLLFAASTVLFDIHGLSKLGLPQLPADHQTPLDGEGEYTWEFRIQDFLSRLSSHFTPPEDASSDGSEGEDVENVLNYYSTDRLATWREYGKIIGFIANSEAERPYVEERGIIVNNAHNTFFELSFIGGVLTAAGFVLIKIYVLLKLFFLLLKNPQEKRFLWAFLVALATSSTGVFNSIFFPAEEIISFLFYFSVLVMASTQNSTQLKIFKHRRQRQ